MDQIPKSPERKRLKTKRFFAWSVHFYTGLGLVAAGAMAAAIIEATPASFRLAFLLMVIATVIDATDGTLARRVRVKEVLPGFDGRRLDDLIDFQTYTALPLLLLFMAGILPPGQEFWLLVPLLSSAYGFCQVSAKTDDGYFLGFPSYWNVIAFYLYVLKPPGAVAIALLLFFSFLTFVPFRYLYPTQRGRLNRLTNQLGFLWCLLLVWILGRLPDEPPQGRNADDTTCILTLVSLFFPVFYLGMSWLVSVRLWKKARKAQVRGPSDTLSVSGA
jgi:phosphatidylcholine synthase